MALLKALCLSYCVFLWKTAISSSSQRSSIFSPSFISFLRLFLVSPPKKIKDNSQRILIKICYDRQSIAALLNSISCPGFTRREEKRREEKRREEKRRKPKARQVKRSEDECFCLLHSFNCFSWLGGVCFCLFILFYNCFYFPFPLYWSAYSAPISARVHRNPIHVTEPARGTSETAHSYQWYATTVHTQEEPVNHLVDEQYQLSIELGWCTHYTS